MIIEASVGGCLILPQMGRRGLSYNDIFEKILKMIKHNSLTMNMKIEVLDIVI